jgi:hypothetical protein
VAIAVWRRTIHVSTTIVRRGLKAVVPECGRRLIHWTADWHVCRALMTRISTGCPCNLILMLFCGVLQLVDRARTCQNGESATELEAFTTTPKRVEFTPYGWRFIRRSNAWKRGSDRRGIQQWLRLQIEQRRVLLFVGLSWTRNTLRAPHLVSPPEWAASDAKL